MVRDSENPLAWKMMTVTGIRTLAENLSVSLGIEFTTDVYDATEQAIFDWLEKFDA